jgi:hypothetical protein
MSPFFMNEITELYSFENAVAFFEAVSGQSVPHTLFFLNFML